MKNCKASNIEELNNIIQNGGEIYVTSANQTQTVTFSFFKHSRDNFSKKEGLYTTIDGGAKLKTTVTTEISKKFEKRYAGYTFKNLEASAFRFISQYAGKNLIDNIYFVDSKERKVYDVYCDYNNIELLPLQSAFDFQYE